MAGKIVTRAWLVSTWTKCQFCSCWALLALTSQFKRFAQMHAKHPHGSKMSTYSFSRGLDPVSIDQVLSAQTPTASWRQSALISILITLIWQHDSSPNAADSPKSLKIGTFDASELHLLTVLRALMYTKRKRATDRCILMSFLNQNCSMIFHRFRPCGSKAKIPNSTNVDFSGQRWDFPLWYISDQNDGNISFYQMAVSIPGFSCWFFDFSGIDWKSTFSLLSPFVCISRANKMHHWKVLEKWHGNH